MREPAGAQLSSLAPQLVAGQLYLQHDGQWLLGDAVLTDRVFAFAQASAGQYQFSLPLVEVRGSKLLDFVAAGMERHVFDVRLHNGAALRCKAHSFSEATDWANAVEEVIPPHSFYPKVMPHTTTTHPRRPDAPERLTLEAAAISAVKLQQRALFDSIST